MRLKVKLYLLVTGRSSSSSYIAGRDTANTML